MNTGKNLWVIVPVYNEEASIIHVTEEWVLKLRDVVGKGQFVFCVLNDGSKDSTGEILHKQEIKYPEMKIIDKVNTGHGQTCVYGYREALKNNAEWIFQIDSDGQCDPKFFKSIWDMRNEHKVIYGNRKKREDGFYRFFISKMVTLVVFAASRNFIKDANVPYRLMHKTALENIIEYIPGNFKLANILISIMQKSRYDIKWVDIVFRGRHGGSPSVKKYSFIKEGIKLNRQLHMFRIGERQQTRQR